MKPQEVEQIEVDLLLEALYRRYGYDFRSYSRASIQRRLAQFLKQEGMNTPTELIPPLLQNENLLSKVVQHFSVCVTEMFRDPNVFAFLQAKVLPVLQTFPFIKTWVAGCASGEEVYSLAILLHEAELLNRSTVYGTDFNDAVLQMARQGVYSLDVMQEFTRNYQESGGKESFSMYYNTSSSSAAISNWLKSHLTFANHNLCSDGVFGEMHLVLCRNVLIYFNRELQDRVLTLFRDSLVHGGFLVLGTKEDLCFSSVADDFEIVDRKTRVFRKRG